MPALSPAPDLKRHPIGTREWVMGEDAASFLGGDGGKIGRQECLPHSMGFDFLWFFFVFGKTGQAYGVASGELGDD